MPADFSGEGIVDLLDYAVFFERMTGPFGDPVLAGWHLLDLDPDYDVDLRDVAAFQRCFSPGVPPNAECARFDPSGAQGVDLTDFADLTGELTGPMPPVP